MKVVFHKSTKVKICIYLIIMMIIMISATVLFISRVSPAFIQKATRTALSEINSIISDTASSTLKDFNVTFNDTSDSADGTSFLSVNTSELNAVRAEFLNIMLKKLDKLSDTYILIPFGNIFKNSSMQGYGIKIPVKVEYTTVPLIDIDSSVITCGINQVKYTVKLVVTVNVSIISAYMCETQTVKTDVPVYENIIIGKIPSYYTHRY